MTATANLSFSPTEGLLQLKEQDAIPPFGGDFGFDGGIESRDACRAPLTR